ncbi:ferric reductase-like transmembrane domain-containing protein [Nocardioides sp. GXZ039]|uniref:ferric reductase-like transmembrane domain-containing protein n=1 Tax=Nocardioides sp. GXZ039 TaxID=3136018 RepID=UPI0030F3C66F
MSAVAEQALWALGRGTGVVALVLMTISVVLGIATRSGREIAGWGRFGVNEIHRAAALMATGLVVVHLGSLLLDPYAQLRWFDVVVPFAGRFRPVWQGLGTLAVDLLVVVMLTSLLRRHVGPRVFRAVHWATYALWPLVVGHAIGNGTDGRSWWLLALAGVCVVAVGSAVAWRLLPGFADRGHRGVRIPRQVPARAGRQA